VAATVVALGTSLPELVVSVQAVLTGYPGIALGNVVGSNIANVLLVVGAAAAICPHARTDLPPRRDTVLMLVISALFVALCLTTGLHRLTGAVLLTGLFLVWGIVLREAAHAQRSAEARGRLEWVLGLPSQTWMILLFIGAGVIGLPIGADLVVDAAVDIAAQLGVSDTVIGLTILAISTSLPELATTLVAACQKRTGVALGTIVGSNVLNILLIMGAASLLSPTPIPIPYTFRVLDFPILLGSALLVGVYVARKRPIGRVAGLVMIVTYTAYVAALYSGR
jgi:cation:H+ antiporter